jgi:hypothetical protein
MLLITCKAGSIFNDIHAKIDCGIDRLRLRLPYKDGGCQLKQIDNDGIYRCFFSLSRGIDAQGGACVSLPYLSSSTTYGLNVLWSLLRWIMGLSCAVANHHSTALRSLPSTLNLQIGQDEGHNELHNESPIYNAVIPCIYIAMFMFMSVGR